jgi:Kef-type K+ transport system membrane component KefB
MSQEILYIGLLFILFVVPKVLQRFRIPSAVTALIFGIIAGPGLGLLTHDDTITLLSTLGIVSLFLFAGLDVSLHELRKERRVLIEHVIVQSVMLGLASWALARVVGLTGRAAVLTALALFTPSTGFILDSLGGWFSNERDRFWVRSKAIATELVALLLLFVVLQSTSLGRLGLAALAMIVMIAVVPLAFRLFAAVVVPHAPRSEFGFLMMVAVACAVVTRQLGVYYLVGAFVVGMAAQQFRERLPALASNRMVGTVESFASLFVPFYFFHAGAALSRTDFSIPSALFAVAFLGIALPVRLLLVGGHRAWRLDEHWRQGFRIGTAMLPTTVFTLVLMAILRGLDVPLPDGLTGGLMFYAIVNTLIPGFALGKSMPGMPGFEEELQFERSTDT